MGDFLELLGLLLAFGAILILCYFTTIFIGKKYSGRSKNKHMKVVETLSLGLDRCLYIILVGNRYFLFLSSKKGLEMVSEIELEERAGEDSAAEDKMADAAGFRRIFETYSGLSKRTDQEQAPGSEEGTGENAGEPGKGILAGIRRLKKLNAKE